MVERLPLPTRVNNSGSAALDPTEVIPRPQPVDQMTAEDARIICGEVVDGTAGAHPGAAQARHRGGRGRRTGRGAVSTAVLSATGAVAGLGLLMSHESGQAAARSPEAAKETPDKAAGDSIDPSLAAAVSAPLKATGGPQTAETTLPRTADESAAKSTRTSASSAGTSSSSSGKHAKPSGSWDSSDWQAAIERAAAAQRAAQSEQGGRHRADEGSGYDYGNGQYGGNGYGYGNSGGDGYGSGGGYGGGPGYGYGH